MIGWTGWLKVGLVFLLIFGVAVALWWSMRETDDPPTQ
jgi:hypothetical protein